MKIVELMTTVPVLGILMVLPMQPPSTTDPGTITDPMLPGPHASSGVDITSVNEGWALQNGVTYTSNGGSPDVVGQTGPYAYISCAGGHSFITKTTNVYATLSFRYDGDGPASRLLFGGRMYVKGLTDTDRQHAESSAMGGSKQLEGQTLDGLPFVFSYDEEKNDNWDENVDLEENVHKVYFNLRAKVTNSP